MRSVPADAPWGLSEPQSDSRTGRLGHPSSAGKFWARTRPYCPPCSPPGLQALPAPKGGGAGARRTRRPQAGPAQAATAQESGLTHRHTEGPWGSGSSPPAAAADSEKPLRSRESGLGAGPACRNLPSMPPHLGGPEDRNIPTHKQTRCLRGAVPPPDSADHTAQVHPHSLGLAEPCESLTGTCHGHRPPPITAKPAPGPWYPEASPTARSPPGPGADFQGPSFPAVGLGTCWSSSS